MERTHHRRSWGWSVWRLGPPRLAAFALIWSAAGAIGNLIDRLLTGAVHDWLRLGATTWNLADFYLVAGLTLGFVGLVTGAGPRALA